jgi:hypothetical protein
LEYFQKGFRGLSVKLLMHVRIKLLKKKLNYFYFKNITLQLEIEVYDEKVYLREKVINISSFKKVVK